MRNASAGIDLWGPISCKLWFSWFQAYILMQVWRMDDSLRVYNSGDYKKKICEFKFKSKLYALSQTAHSSLRSVGSKVKLECCFECVLTSYFVYTVTFKVMVLDSFSRHNPLGESHLVLRDLLPDREFDKWLVVEMDKRVSYSNTCWQFTASYSLILHK